MFRSRVVNPKWHASIPRHGDTGGLELAATVEYLFGQDATADVLEDWVFERVTEAYVHDRQMREFLRRSNPWAMRDIAGRLLEAADRGLWAEPNEAARTALESRIWSSTPRSRVAARG